MIDDRIHCTTCANLQNRHCLAYAELGASRGYIPQIQPRRCHAYVPASGEADRRTGAERWPWLQRFKILGDVPSSRFVEFRQWAFDQAKAEHDRDAYGRRLKPGT